MKAAPNGTVLAEAPRGELIEIKGTGMSRPARRLQTVVASATPYTRRLELQASTCLAPTPDRVHRWRGYSPGPAAHPV